MIDWVGKPDSHATSVSSCMTQRRHQSRLQLHCCSQMGQRPAEAGKSHVICQACTQRRVPGAAWAPVGTFVPHERPVVLYQAVLQL